MWPFHQTPIRRLQHRLLKRLRAAYLLTEDLPSHRLATENLRLIGKAGQQAADDETLYAHWFEQPMPLALAHASILETKAWNILLKNTHDLVTQGYYPDAYEKEARGYTFIGHVLQDLIQFQLDVITRPDRTQDEGVLRTLKGRLKL